MADGIATITREVKKLDSKAAISRVPSTGRTRSAKYRLLEIAKQVKRRTGDKVAEVRAITRKIMKTAKGVVAQAERIIDSADYRLSRLKRRN